MDPLSFSPPDNPTTQTVISLLGPPTAAESPLLRVSPPETIDHDEKDTRLQCKLEMDLDVEGTV